MSAFFTTEKGSISGLDFFTVKSPALKKRSDACFYRPESIKKGVPLVILLHGVYGSNWSWALKANVHKTLEKGIASGHIPPMLLAMPSDGHFQDGSGYLKHHEQDYEKWITEDVISLAKEAYPEVNESSLIFLAGLSMGGYGALRLGAKHPSIFKAFSGLSSITKFEQHKSFLENIANLEKAATNQENVLELLLQNKNSLRPFRFDCGKEDSLYTANVKLHQELLEEDIPHDFYSYDGEHSWEYWAQNIEATLRFFAKHI